MATKTITVTKEANESLKALKRSDESFSETLLRVTGHRKNVWKGYGALYGERGEALADDGSIPVSGRHRRAFHDDSERLGRAYSRDYAREIRSRGVGL